MKIKIRPSAKKAGSKSPTTATRKALAAKGQAMPDDSFPTPNVDFLKRAVKSIGRTPPGKRPAVVAYLKKRAKKLKNPKAVANLTNQLDAIELTVNTPPHLTPGARAVTKGNKGRVPAVAGKGAPGSSPAAAPAKGAAAAKAAPKLGLKTPRGASMYAKLRKKNVPHPVAIKACKKMEQGMDASELSNSPKA